MTLTQGRLSMTLHETISYLNATQPLRGTQFFVKKKKERKESKIDAIVLILVQNFELKHNDGCVAFCLKNKLFFSIIAEQAG